jgi:hypothetical protein
VEAAHAEDPAFIERLRALQAWQSARLQRTHADLSADERYGPGVDFFIEDLYAPRDFADRDADIERAYPYMVRLLPRGVLDTAADAMHLYVLTRELDAAMVDALHGTLAVTTIDEENYAEAYRVCDAYAERVEQLEIIASLAQRLDRHVRSPLILGTLRVTRGPAHLAGLGALQDFLERGVSAFHHMRGSQEFVDTVTRRERRILDRIFAGDADPFALPQDGGVHAG